MKTRAAVAVEAGKPIEVMEVDLDGPRAGEVLVEIMATGICHTDLPKVVDWCMEGKIDIDPMNPHTLALEDLNKGFDLMHADESV